jgi:hypothetical protein
MSETTEGILAGVFYIAVLAWGVWRNRKTPGYWSAEAIRERSRTGLRIMTIGGCVIVILVSFLTAFYGDRGYLSAILWSVPFGGVIWLCWPPWARRSQRVNPPTQNPDASSESN